jgi:hypothetical protein
VPAGRPTRFNKKLAATIFERIARGEFLRAICREDGMPDRGTVRNWALNDPEFFTQYERARDLGFDELAEEGLEIAATPVKAIKLTQKTDADGKKTQEMVVTDAVDRSRLHFDAIRWGLGKWSKRYGDKLQIDTSKGGDHLEQVMELIRKGPAKTKPTKPKP